MSKETTFFITKKSSKCLWCGEEPLIADHREPKMLDTYCSSKCYLEANTSLLMKQDRAKGEVCKDCGMDLREGFCLECDGAEFPFGSNGHSLSE